jgi:polyisoprenoid-binding protein YceI
VYSVDSSGSEVYLRIYAAGALAALAHNHIISAGEFSGRVVLTADPAASQWDLSFPVAELVVDDAELRARYGEDFESGPSDNDKSGTKRNMLSDGLLNGAAFPEIRFSGTGVNGTLENAQLAVSIEIAGSVVDVVFPARISIGDGEVVVSGEYRVTHEDLGLTPFTAMAGAMAVAEEIDFTYRIRAVAGGQ